MTAKTQDRALFWPKQLQASLCKHKEIIKTPIPFKIVVTPTTILRSITASVASIGDFVAVGSIISR
jgi:hypothetical protein